MSLTPTSVLVAGIAGASLGTEIAKALRLAGGYRLIGCDISPLAFGHYGKLFDRTFLVSRQRYVDDVISIAREEGVRIIVPGAEEPTSVLAAQNVRLVGKGIDLATNDPELVERMSDKSRCFAALERLGFAIPRTVPITDARSLDAIPLPCVIKPATGSGGSAFVFFARDRDEAEVYATYIAKNGRTGIAQQYVPHEGGEFTVGVLSGRDKSIEGVVALKRVFPSKLSVHSRGADFLISSGVSQGHIGEYREICATAAAIASALGSKGPLNIQGRVDKTGRFLPFEINARFSATTYLRSLAGFNEVDHYVRRLLGLVPTKPLVARPGWYFRSLTEAFVSDEALLS